MTEKCCDEGAIQAFLDGELDSDALERVARHTASCADCALLLREAEADSAFAFSALGEEFNSLVPTERIRTNLYDAIARIDKPRTSFWQRISGGQFSFANPSVVVFGGLLIVFGIFATLLIQRETQNAPNTMATTKDTPAESKKPTEIEFKRILPVENAPVKVAAAKQIIIAKRQSVSTNIIVEKAAYQPKIENSIYKATRVNQKTPFVAEAKNDALLGEENYVKTIQTLTDTVNSRKENVLRPSEQIAFAREMAVVDNAISEMRKEVRTNPKNESAKQVLRSSYQNKIDLLNSVTEKTELMASLK